MQLSITPIELGERLDLFLVEKFSDYSRSQIQQGIDGGRVLVNGKIRNSSYKLREGDTVEFDKDAFAKFEQAAEIIGENIPLDILYQDSDLAVINKPAGMVVHPAAGNSNNTLVNALLNQYPEIANVKTDDSDLAALRPGIVHRLDKDTTGVILVAKNQKTLESLSKQLKNRSIKKRYLALVSGWPSEKGSLKDFLARDKKNRKKIATTTKDDGREAISNFKVVDYFATKEKQPVSLLEIEIPTGRTHQIRVQFKHAGFPLIGDQTYNTKESRELSKKLGATRQMLHAANIVFTKPDGNSLTSVTAEEPADFQKVKSRLTSHIS